MTLKKWKSPATRLSMCRAQIDCSGERINPQYSDIAVGSQAQPFQLYTVDNALRVEVLR